MEKFLDFLCFFPSHLWTVILIDKFLGPQLYKYMQLMCFELASKDRDS